MLDELLQEQRNLRAMLGCGEPSHLDHEPVPLAESERRKLARRLLAVDEQIVALLGRNRHLLNVKF